MLRPQPSHTGRSMPKMSQRSAHHFGISTLAAAGLLGAVLNIRAICFSAPSTPINSVPIRMHSAVTHREAAVTIGGSAADLWTPSTVSSGSAVTMYGGPWFAKDNYKDGWRFGGKNMWMEDQMGGNWMNITTLSQYTFPSGRLKPRVMTKLRMADHKRAMRYIKRLRHFGLMPFHRLQAKVGDDALAKRSERAPGNKAVIQSSKMSKSGREAVDDVMKS